MTSADPARIVGLIDLASLHESDTSEVVGSLCDRAVTPPGPVAAECVLPARTFRLGASSLLDDLLA